MRLCKRLGICFLIAAFFWMGTVIGDRQLLDQRIIRLHIKANSDSLIDQQIKLDVRDAVIASLQESLVQVSDVNLARQYMIDSLPKIEAVANQTLKSLGCGDTASVRFGEAKFDTRYYDTFALPAGVYHALQIFIGEGKGRNWWCVAFPQLCYGTTSENVVEAAADTGFTDSLGKTITDKDHYEVRFFLLDLMGNAKNILFRE